MEREQSVEPLVEGSCEEEKVTHEDEEEPKEERKEEEAGKVEKGPEEGVKKGQDGQATPLYLELLLMACMSIVNILFELKERPVVLFGMNVNNNEVVLMCLLVFGMVGLSRRNMETGMMWFARPVIAVAYYLQWYVLLSRMILLVTGETV